MNRCHVSKFAWVVVLVSMCLCFARLSVARAEVRLGLMAPISGPAAVFGRSLVVGAEQAVEDINAAGGVLGQKLVLAVKDTACKAKQAPLVIRELVAKERVVAVVGFVCSGPAIAAAQAAREFGIPLIVAGATSDVITDRNLVGNVFRLAPRRDSAALPIVEHIALARISHEG